MSDDARMQARHAFVERVLGTPPVSIEPASSDASNRSYWRVASAAAPTRVLMDAPHDADEVRTWLDVGERLRAAGLHAPAVDAADADLGFVLMEDLGERLYLPELDADSADALYGDALDALARMQARVDTRGLPAFDRTRLVDEMELMPAWLLERHFGHVPSCDEWDVLEGAFTFLANDVLEQPRTFMHRDFHSRNLLVAARTGIADEIATPAIVDFQGAVAGPIAYDLASLLRDCYIEWPIERVDGWVESHRLRLRHAHLLGTDVDAARFRRWFDLVGLQRHIKVLGLFCRLWYRDGKQRYLDDLPLVWRYVVEVAPRYPELAGLVQLLQRARGARDLTRPA